VDRILLEHGARADRLVPILYAVQDSFGYLPMEALERIGEKAGIRPAEVMGVATFYSRFRLRPAGRHTIQVCIGTACHVKGAERLIDAFRDRLRIAADSDTDPEGLFTVEGVACLGCCMLAPAVRIDEVIYGHVDALGIPGILKDFLASREAAKDGGGDVPLEAAVKGEARICTCSSCAAGGADAVLRRIREESTRLGLPVAVKVVGCTGRSDQAPLLDVALEDGTLFRYGRVAPEHIPRILQRHFVTRRGLGRIRTKLEEWLLSWAGDPDPEPVIRYPDESRDEGCACSPDAPRVAMEGAGEDAPLDIDAYREGGGFAALGRALSNGSPEEIVAEIEASGLRGRGGGGYPTGAKWRSVLEAPGGARVVVCNGDEGDPGAFMDRMILESYPLRVVEGMAVAMAALGAEEGIAYIRSEYPLAIARFSEALRRSEEAGILGENALGSGRMLAIRVAVAGGAFVCGEETALLASLEGKRGTPRYRPPYPSERGLHGRPTLVNNVETFALVPWILRNGAMAFRSLGTDGSPGTKTFALAGRIDRGGLVEVPMGITLRGIVDDVGGGVSGGRTLKAVQVGGPSGGCVPERLCGTPVGYEELGASGTMMGSGGLVVLDETDCMVDVARYFMKFTAEESCGKCSFCRIGTKRMLEILEDLCEGRGRPSHLDELERLSAAVSAGSLCGLGRTAPNPVLSTLLHFREEFEAHAEGCCPVGKCRALVTYRVTERCIGCTRCGQRCPAGAITPVPYERQWIDPEACTKCDLCRQSCPNGAIERIPRKETAIDV